MTDLCGWSGDRLAERHPRYAKIFRRNYSEQHESPDAGAQIHSLNDHEEQLRPEPTAVPAHVRRRITPPPPLPAAPQPSADKALHEVDAAEALTADPPVRLAISPPPSDVDIWAMSPVQAVNFLCAYVEILLKRGPPKPRRPLSPPVSDSSANSSRAPTPGPTASASSNLSDKINAALERSNDRGIEVNVVSPDSGNRGASSGASSPSSSSPADTPHLMRVPRASRTPIDSPVSNPRTPIHSVPPSPRLPHIVVTEFDRQRQSHHLAKRFFCKSVPNVSLAAYLGRIHKYCRMATAVYLAAGIYIETLSQGGDYQSGYPHELNHAVLPAEGARAILVELTSRSVHRLLLAALRVANKALSDLYWPHKRVAEVGGVSQLELQRLELSMCYLCDFKLQVNMRDLEAFIRRGRALGVVDSNDSGRE